MAWIDISNAEVAAGAPLTTALVTALRDNVAAALQRAVGGPKSVGFPYDYQEFTVSGTWTKPTSAESGDRVIVQVVGGGGEGSRISANNDPNGGGGGGGIIYIIDDIDQTASTESIAVGAGAPGATGFNGTDGGGSNFGTDDSGRQYIRADGGIGGRDALNDGEGGAAYATYRGSTSNGSATTGLDECTGGTGGLGTVARNSVYGGGSGGYNNLSNTGVNGGFSLFAGAGGEGTNGSGSVSNFNIDGLFPGGGGAAVITELSDDTVSGAGGDGVVRVWCIKEAA